MPRRKQTRTGQVAVNFLERCLTLTAMAEQRLYDAKITWFAFLDGNEDPSKWSKGGCPDDFQHADDWGLNGEDRESFLDWCANQRHYFLLCESGADDVAANRRAQDDRTLLRIAPRKRRE